MSELKGINITIQGQIAYRYWMPKPFTVDGIEYRPPRWRFQHGDIPAEYYQTGDYLQHQLMFTIKGQE